MAKCRSRYGDPWNVPIDGAIPADDTPIQARLSERPGPLLCFTKRAVAYRLLKLNKEMTEQDYLIRWATPTLPYMRGLAALLRYREVVRFVGDLDPCDLGAFRALQTGSPDLRPQRGWRLSLHFAGVDSHWMDLCDQVLGTDIGRYTIRMSRLERAQYRALKLSWPGLRETVGDRAMALLDEGRKLEVEGATWHSLSNKAFTRPLTDLILGATRNHRAAFRAIRLGDEDAAMKAADGFAPSPTEQALLLGDVREGWTHPVNQRAAILALMNVHQPKDSNIFVEVLSRQGTEPPLKAAAVQALGRAMDGADRRTADWRRGAQALLAALRDRSPDVRCAAALAVGAARIREAAPVLRQLVSSRSRSATHGPVAHVARAAVSKIETGRWPEAIAGTR